PAVGWVEAGGGLDERVRRGGGRIAEASGRVRVGRALRSGAVLLVGPVRHQDPARRPSPTWRRGPRRAWFGRGPSLRRPLRASGPAARRARVQLATAAHGLPASHQRTSVVGRRTGPRRLGRLGGAGLVEALLVEALGQGVPRQRG